MSDETPIPADAANPQQTDLYPRQGYLATAPFNSNAWRKQLLEIYEETVSLNPFIRKDMLRDGKPHVKQQRFLMHSQTQEVFFGGSCGGGKSVSLLLAALQFVQMPGYNALILRQSFPDLSQPGALIPLSKEWLAGTGAKWSQRDKRWTFPSNATITFGYLERHDDVQQYHGSAFSFIGFDELSQFDQDSYLYLFSRLRKRDDLHLPLRMRATSNPGGKGAAWVKKRFIDADTRPAGVIFLPARLKDNPSLNYDDYVRSLSHLPPVERKQLLEGDWEASAEGQFKRHWFGARWRFDQQAFHLLSGTMEIGKGIPLRDCGFFVTVDLATTARTSSDYTVFLACAVTPWKQLLILRMERKKHPIEQVPSNLLAFCWQVEQEFSARPAWVGIESNGAQIAIASQCRLQEGMPPIAYLTPGNQDKLARANAAILACERGHVLLPLHASWLDDFLYELVLFTGDPKKDAYDDVVDALSYAVNNMHRAHYETPTYYKPPGENRDQMMPKADDGMTRIMKRPGRLRRLFGGY